MTDMREKFEKLMLQEGNDIAREGNGTGKSSYQTYSVNLAWIAVEVATESMTAENQRLREAIRQVIEDGVQITKGPYSHHKNNKCKHGMRGYEGCEQCIEEHLSKALAGNGGE